MGRQFIANVKAVLNGSRTPRSGALMKGEIESLKNMTILDEEMTVTSSLKAGSESEIDALADAIAASVKGRT